MELHTPPSEASPAHARCEHCAAKVPAGAPWCSLCLTPTASREVIHAPTPALDPLTAPLEVLLAGKHVAPESVQELLAAPAPSPAAPAPSPASGPVWPCASCGHPNALDDATCAACGAGFLEAVRLSEPPLLALPVVGDVSRLSRGQQLLLACLLSSVLGTVVLALVALLG